MDWDMNTLYVDKTNSWLLLQNEIIVNCILSYKEDWISKNREL